MIIPINSPPKTWRRKESNKYCASGLSHLFYTVTRTRFSSADIISARSASVELIMTDVIVWDSVTGKPSEVCTKKLHSTLNLSNGCIIF